MYDQTNPGYGDGVSNLANTINDTLVSILPFAKVGLVVYGVIAVVMFVIVVTFIASTFGSIRRAQKRMDKNLF